MTSYFNDRQSARALQECLERYERLIREGAEPAKARRQVEVSMTPEIAPLFALSVGVGSSAVPVASKAPAFAGAFEAKLRSARVVKPLIPRRRPGMPGLATVAAAACIAVLGGLLSVASRSLPGDALYSVKRASEAAQLDVVSGTPEARLRLNLADKRLHEVQGLVRRTGSHVIGVPGRVSAAAVSGISDPRIAQLIKDTLADAERDITSAADILIQQPADKATLDKLANVAHRGKNIAVNVASDLPISEIHPILDTAVAMATVEQNAKEASQKASLPECATPTPTPKPTMSPEPTATPTPSAEPTETPTEPPTTAPTAHAKAIQTPEPTPCASPSPSPSPSPTASPSGSPATTNVPGGTGSSPDPSAGPTRGVAGPSVNASGDGNGHASSGSNTS